MLFFLVNQKHIKIKKSIDTVKFLNKLLIHVHIFFIMIFLKYEIVEIQLVSEKTGLYRQKRNSYLKKHILNHGSNIFRNINRHLFTFFPVAFIHF